MIGSSPIFSPAPAGNSKNNNAQAGFIRSMWLKQTLTMRQFFRKRWIGYAQTYVTS